MNTNEDELKNAIINHLTEWFRGLGIETHQIENSADKILALIAQEVHKAHQEGENFGRIDECIKITEWGKTIDAYWNKHFADRLAQLKDKEEE